MNGGDRPLPKRALRPPPAPPVGGATPWGLALALLASLLVATPALGQSTWGSEASRTWARKQAEGWYLRIKDPRGQNLWTNTKFSALSYGDQTAQLLEHLKEGDSSRRAALVLLGERPLETWARPALRKAANRDEVAHYLYLRGYRYPEKDPFAYLEPGGRLDRPWTHGLGLHLDGQDAWRFQWIPSPVLLSKIDAPSRLPKALERAPQPGVLLRLKQLRPGLERLKALGGGEGGVSTALAQGSRAGFLLRHLDPWLKQAATALEPLANREAWILHYGVGRDAFGPSGGTLVFLPGDLPTRTKLTLELLKLNPLSKGARSHSVNWNGVQVTQVRGAGGVLSLVSTPEGTWISDREAPLRSLLFPLAQTNLGDRQEWCKVALAALRVETEVSLWIMPRTGADAGFERAAIRRRLQGANQGVWPNPFIAKAAPRTGALALSLGAGPTEALLTSLLRLDNADPISDPEMATFADGGANLTPEQNRAFQAELQRAKSRREGRKGLREDLNGILGALDLRGAAVYWNGWVEPPALSAAQKAALAQFQRLRDEDRWKAMEQQRAGKVGYFGGFGEPGMTPSLAVSVALKPGQRASLQAALGRLLPRMFRGQHQKRPFAGVEIHRILTEQAFAPAYVFVNDTLVVGTDDASVQAVAAGLLGQAPTLADYPGQAFAKAELDGPKVSAALESLLLAYLRASGGGRSWWWLEGPATSDEASAEVASTFGPFLGAIKGLGKRTLDLDWGPGGLEARPR